VGLFRAIWLLLSVVLAAALFPSAPGAGEPRTESTIVARERATARSHEAREVARHERRERRVLALARGSRVHTANAWMLLRQQLKHAADAPRGAVMADDDDDEDDDTAGVPSAPSDDDDDGDVGGDDALAAIESLFGGAVGRDVAAPPPRARLGLGPAHGHDDPLDHPPRAT